ncbi:MAG: ROK family protein [Alphaproteobacteria bacterium]|nr:ROK family protein [Alphaproteobacteria bacterium]
MAELPLFGGIELGGTKVVAAIGRADGTLLSSRTLPTTTPHHVIDQLIDYFQEHPVPIKGLGVGAFGPVVVDHSQPDYGCLLETNKPGWSGFDLAGGLAEGLNVPIHLVTDVAAAGFGEAQFGALRGVDLGVYLTIGTGIGGAILHKGLPLPAMLHPEMGHLSLERHPRDLAASTCRFHSNCAEGLAAGPAILARFGKSLSAYAPDDEELLLVADYLGQLCAQLVLLLSPHKIVLGGGVGQTPGLIDATQSAMLRRLGGYASQGTSAKGYLCPPELGQQAGIIGALACANTLLGAH